jgi:hypothetical protein
LRLATRVLKKHDSEIDMIELWKEGGHACLFVGHLRDKRQINTEFEQGISLTMTSEGQNVLPSMFGC